jgi:predicted amidohydrolase YtcJ
VGLAWARLRRLPGAPERVPYVPGQALTGEEALLGYTVWAAAVAGDEKLYGRLAPGMAADVTAFAQDPVDTPADELPGVPVRLTVVDGEVVHRT